MKEKRSRPPKIENLLSEIRECIETGNYRISIHSHVRQEERCIDLTDVRYVLKNGYHEKVKTRFDEAFNTWKYAI